MLKKTILLTALAAALTATGASAATFDVFNDEMQWDERVVNWTTEDFEDSTLAEGLQSIESKTKVGRIERGPWTIETTGLLTSNSLKYGLEEGQWRDVLTKHGSLEGKARTTISFDIDVTSFGALFDILPASKGTGILMTFNHGGNTVFSTEVTYFEEGTGFWGIVSENVFDEIVMTHGSQAAIKETYAMNYMKYDVNLAAARVPVPDSAVPLPGAIWMFVSALIGMTFVRRRPQAKRAHA
jgi:hypothetical protein